MEGMMRCAANYVPLSPISFLERAAKVNGHRTAIVCGSIRYTWQETRERCHRLASVLARMGISRGDVVAVLSPNSPAMYELHYAAPIAGALICAMTTHHDPAVLSDLILRSAAKLLFVHPDFLSAAQQSLLLLPSPIPLIPLSHPEYDSLLLTGDPHFPVQWPLDEFDPISISFTSGTTATPQKGVLHTHRAAFLNSVATLLLLEMPSLPTFLWATPMHHCNGWSFIWAIAAQCGTNVILSSPVDPTETLYSAIVKHHVTHLAATTPVLAAIADDDGSNPLPHRVDILFGSCPPPAPLLHRVEERGFRVTHAGGQTEAYCCAIYCVWRPEWDGLPAEERARLKARQGVPHLMLAEADVKDPETMESVAADGRSIGEIVYRGNNVMGGYLDRKATEKAFRGGWFHSGDAGVVHPDGYIELKDRLTDIVVSGGRMIGTVDIQSAIYGHPAVRAAAVVGRPDEELGQTVCAFVELKEGAAGTVTEEEIVEFCRGRLPEEMVPKSVVFDEIPVTLTGKTKKGVLREKAAALGSLPRGV